MKDANEQALAGIPAELEDQIAEAVAKAIDAARKNDPAIAQLQARLAASELENSELRRKASEKQLVDQHLQSANESHASSKERFAIVIDEARDANEIDPVYVGANGRGYHIKRGQVVKVPREVVSVLTDAVEDRAVPRFDARGNPTGLDVRRARRFPFTNLGLAIDAAGNATSLVIPEVNPVA